MGETLTRMIAEMEEERLRKRAESATVSIPFAELRERVTGDFLVQLRELRDETRAEIEKMLIDEIKQRFRR